MKPKYRGILAAFSFMASVLLPILYAIYMPEPAYEFKRERKQDALSGVYIPSPAVLQKMDAAKRYMAAIAGLQKPDTSPVNLSIFGYRPVSRGISADLSGKKRTRLRPIDSDYRLTLAFSAGKSSFCMINDSLYAPGDTLPGGARVIKIESKRVMIRTLGSDIWITLAGKSAGAVSHENQLSKKKP